MRRAWVPSRFIAWLIVSILFAVLALTTGGLAQALLLVVALAPLAALTLSALRRRVPSLGQAILVAAVLLFAAGKPSLAAWLILLGLLAVLFLDAWVRTTKTRVLRVVPAAPSLVRIERLNREELVQAGAVAVHDRVVVRSGERAAVDGRLLSAQATVLPLFATTAQRIVRGEMVKAGTFAQTRLVLDAVTVGDTTTLAVLARLAERVAREIPPRITRIDRLLFGAQLVWSGGLISWWFVAPERPVVALVSLAGIWWAGSLVARLTWLLGLARSFERGLLIKTWEVTRRVRHLQAVVFDKTGTLTTGLPDITQIQSRGKLTQEDILRIAGALEFAIDHPIAHAIKRAVAERRIDLPLAEGVQPRSSLGLVGTIEGEQFAVGNLRLLTALSLDVPSDLQHSSKQQESQGASVVYVASERAVLGAVVLKDVARESARPLIQTLQRHGFSEIQLLSGDSSLVARALAATVGITPESVFAHMTRELKKTHVSHLPRHEVMVVGDPQAEHDMLEAAGLAIGFLGWGQVLGSGQTQISILAPNLGLVWQALRFAKNVQRVWWMMPLLCLAVSGAVLAVVLPDW